MKFALAQRRHRAVVVALLAAAPIVLGGVPASATTLAPTTTTFKLGPTTVISGQLARMKVTVQESAGTALPTGTVTINDSGISVGSGPLVDTNGVMTAILKISFHPGSHSLSASYGGDTLNATSGSASSPLTVSKAATTVVLTAHALSTPGAYKIGAVAKVTKPGKGIPTGSATFVVNGGPPTLVSLDSVGHAHVYVKFTVGTPVTVSVTYSGDGDFTGSPGTLTFTA